MNLPPLSLEAIRSVLGELFAGRAPARAQLLSLSLGPDRSQAGLSGSAVGFNVEAQVPGSRTAQLQGTVNVEIRKTTDPFTGGSVLDAFPSGEWEPLPKGGLRIPAKFARKPQLPRR